MTQPHWYNHAPPPPSSEPSLTHSGNGGSLGDLRERVRALEVRTAHSDRYMYDRIGAHNARLLAGDEKMGQLSQEQADTKRQVLANSEGIASIRASQQDLHGQVSEMRAVAAAQTMAADNRRAARKEVAKLALWAVLILVVLGTITGHIPKERLEALQHLKMLPGL